MKLSFFRHKYAMIKVFNVFFPENPASYYIPILQVIKHK